MCGLLGRMAMDHTVLSDVPGQPVPKPVLSCSHVSPPSTLRYSPQFVPAKRVLRLSGCTANARTSASTNSPLERRLNVAPPSVLRHSPSPTVPTNRVPESDIVHP